jgi:hypothetical protein
MGDIAPSKVPKARTIKKKDGNLPVSLYKEGGSVNEAGKQFAAKKTAAYRK